MHKATYRNRHNKARSFLGRHAGLDKQPFLRVRAQVLLDKVGNLLILSPCLRAHNSVDVPGLKVESSI